MKQVLAIIITLSIFSQTYGNLASSLNQADYLIITVPQFESALQKLADYRTEDGLTVKIVFVDDIYLEFKGVKGSDKIINFISTALTYWQEPTPQYILLAGDVEFVPSVRDTSIGLAFAEQGEDSVSLDSWYSVNQFQDDFIPDIAVGRIPGNNPKEFETAINKIILYENLLSDEPNNNLVLVDKQDGIAFQSLAEKLIEKFEQAEQNHTLLSAYTDSNIINLKKSLFEKISSGLNFIQYVGHGNPTQLSESNLFNIRDVCILENSHQPFIFSSLGCRLNFDMHNDSTLTEMLLFKEEGGSVANIGSSGLNYLHQSGTLFSSLYESIYTNKIQTLGDALLNTQIELNIDVQSPQRRYTLIGDPALKIFPDVVAGNDYVNQYPSQFVLLQNYPNPFNPTTEIRFSITQSDFVTLTVYDMLGKEIETLINEQLTSGSHIVKFNASNLATGVYLYKLQAGSRVKTNKMMLVK